MAASPPPSDDFSRHLVFSRWLGLILPLTLMACLLMLVVGVLTTLTHRGLQNQSEQEIETRALESVALLSRQLSSDLQAIERLGYLLASQATRLLTAHTSAAGVSLPPLQLAEDGSLFNQTRDAAAIYLPATVTARPTDARLRFWQLQGIGSLLHDAYHSYPLISRAYLKAPDTASVVYPWMDLRRQLASMDSEYFPASLRASVVNNPTQQAVWTDAYLHPVTGDWLLSLSLPVIVDDQVAAVIGLDIRLDSLQQQLAQMNVPWGGYSMLMDRDGSLLAFPPRAEPDWKIAGRTPAGSRGARLDELNLLQRPDYRRWLEPLQLDAAGLVSLPLESRSVLLSWSTVQPTDWKLLQVVPADQAETVIDRLENDYRILLWLGAVALLVLLLTLIPLLIWRDHRLREAFGRHLQLQGKAATEPAAGGPVPRTEAALLSLIAGPLSICRFDEAGCILACNLAFEHLTQSPVAGLRGRRLRDLPLLQSLPSELEGDEIELTRGGQEAVKYWVSQHRSEAGSGVLLLLDISRYSQLRQQLQNERQRVRLAARMKAEFFQVASADANRSIQELQQLVRELDRSDQTLCQQKLLALQHLLDDMRDMAGEVELDESEVKQDRFRLQPLVEEAVKTASSLFQNPDRRLLVDYQSHLPDELQGDRRRINRLMTHLLRQMVQLSGQGDIHLQCGWLSPGVLQLQLRDEGGGIAEADRLRRFELSTPLGNSYEPTTGALGQLLTRQLVQEMKGTLDVQAQPGGGLLIQLTLPVRAVDPQQPRPRILVVDDGPVNSMLASSVLEKVGYQVDVAASGSKALDLGRIHTYDLVLMDIFMPDMDGLEATRRWRQLPGRNAGIPVIAITANALAADRESFLQAGLNDHLAKPYRPAELRALAQHWLAQLRGDV